MPGNVINGSAITAERINNVRDIFDLARNSTGVARIQLLSAAFEVCKDVTDRLVTHIEVEKDKA